MAGSIGWRGFALIGDTSRILPLTGSDLTQKLELYMSEAIHGGGIGTVDGRFHSRINVAQGRRVVDGTISGEVFTGTGGAADAFVELLKRTIGESSSDTSLRDDGFDAATPIIISPGGGSTFSHPDSGQGSQAKAVVQNMTINGNNGGIVNFSAGIFSAGREEFTGTLPDITSYSFEPAGTTADDSNPQPYWKATFAITGSGETDISDRITDWSFTVNNNTQPVYTFNDSQFAFDVLQGLMEVSGTFSYYSSDGTFVDELLQGSEVVISLGGETLCIPYLAIAEAPIPLPGLNAPTVRNVNFTGLASSSRASIFRA